MLLTQGTLIWKEHSQHVYIVITKFIIKNYMYINFLTYMYLIIMSCITD